MNSPRPSSLPQSLNGVDNILNAPLSPRSKFDVKFPDLSAYLSRLDDNVSKLLKNPSVFRMVQSGHPQILEFLCKNINSLIFAAFDPYDLKVSNIAFTLLMMNDTKINETLLEKEILKQAAIKALHRDDKRFALKRIIHIIQNSILANEVFFPTSLYFISIFIPYIGETCVFYFFKTILSNELCYIPIQEWLIEADFPMILAEEMAFTFKKGKRATEFDINHSNNILQLVVAGRNNNRMADSFLHHRLIEVLNINWKGLRTEIFDDLWETILSCYTFGTAPLLRGLFQKAVELIILPYETVSRYRVCVIDLITSMLQTDMIVKPYIIAAHLELSVLRLLFQFQGSTFMQNSLLKLCRVAFEVPEMRDDFVDAVISPLLYEGIEIKNRILIAFSCNLIQKAFSVGKASKSFMTKLKTIPNFEPFVNVTLQNRIKLLNNNYGGRVPRFKIRELTIEDA